MRPSLSGTARIARCTDETANRRSGDDLLSDDRRKLGRLVVKKGRESVEVGERIVRPFEIY